MLAQSQRQNRVEQPPTLNAYATCSSQASLTKLAAISAHQVAEPAASEPHHVAASKAARARNTAAASFPSAHQGHAVTLSGQCPNFASGLTGLTPARKKCGRSVFVPSTGGEHRSVGEVRQCHIVTGARQCYERRQPRPNDCTEQMTGQPWQQHASSLGAHRFGRASGGFVEDAFGQRELEVAVREHVPWPAHDLAVVVVLVQVDLQVDRAPSDSSRSCSRTFSVSLPRSRPLRAGRRNRPHLARTRPTESCLQLCTRRGRAKRPRPSGFISKLARASTMHGSHARHVHAPGQEHFICHRAATAPLQRA